MYLGEYVIAKNNVNEEKMLEALCLQIESTPSLLRLALENELITSSEGISLIGESIKTGSHFFDLLLEKKSDKQAEVRELLKFQAEKRGSLGMYLAEVDALGIDAFEKTLSDYFSNLKTVNEPNENAPESNDAPEINAEALAALKELEGFDDSSDEIKVLEGQISSILEKPEVVKDKGKDNQFVKVFTEEKFIELKNYSELLMATKQVELLDEFEKLFHTLLGICRFENMNLVERFLSDLEKYVTLSKKNWSDEKVQEGASLQFSNSVELLWEMRHAIFETGREVEAFSRANLKIAYLNITKSLTSLLGV